jgi:hypothetical protein
MEKNLEAKKTQHLGRSSVLLSNGTVRLVIDPVGGMTPEFSIRRGNEHLRAHWLPEFREETGAPYSEKTHGSFWKAKLLYNIAGDFLCSPNFGPDCVVDGVSHPAHGWTAEDEWTVEGLSVDEGRGSATARFSMKSPDASMPLRWDRNDQVFAGQPAYFSSVRISNSGNKPLSINVARHNTIGSPFLEAGCRISLSADRFIAAPAGTEFDTTGRLVQGGEFSSLASAPLRSGGTVDLSLVPGMIGSTDLITGAIPRKAGLGWSCVVNPKRGLAYLCFFPGAANLPAGEIALSFNDLWLQYGGRRFTPWAKTEGGEDRTYCLGTENAVGAFANGLEWSRANPVLLGNPTMVEIPAGGSRTLRYGVAIVELGADLVREGVAAVEAEEGAMILKGAKAFQRVAIGADFALARHLAGL